MRRSAYLKAVEEAKALPTEIPEMKRYFGDSYNPRQMALLHIKRKAREDTDALSDGEMMDVLNSANDKAQPRPESGH